MKNEVTTERKRWKDLRSSGPSSKNKDQYKAEQASRRTWQQPRRGTIADMGRWGRKWFSTCSPGTPNSIKPSGVW